MPPVGPWTVSGNAWSAGERDAPGSLRSMQRRCARPGCGGQATATLAYDYAQGVVWLEHLSDDSHPMTHDLCSRHADTLSVPRGWVLQDARTRVTPLFADAHMRAS